MHVDLHIVTKVEVHDGSEETDDLVTCVWEEEAGDTLNVKCYIV